MPAPRFPNDEQHGAEKQGDANCGAGIDGEPGKCGEEYQIFCSKALPAERSPDDGQVEGSTHRG